MATEGGTTTQIDVVDPTDGDHEATTGRAEACNTGSESDDREAELSLSTSRSTS